MRRFLMILATLGALSVASVAAADEYHVYKNSNGECEIDSRSHEQWKNQRGTDTCFGHFSSLSSAQELRIKKFAEGSCKCPSGETCK